MHRFARDAEDSIPSSNNEQPRIKICHVAATSDGATWMHEQLRDLRDRYNYEVVAVVSGHQGRLVEKLKSDGIRFHVADFAAGPGPLRDILRMPISIVRLALFFRRERFDIVHHHIFVSMRIARPAAWLADVPVRLSMLAGPFHLQAPTSRWIERLTAWMDTMLIPSCEKSLELCREIGVAEDQLGPVIYYGPDDTKFDPETVQPLDVRAQFGWSPDTPIITMVAFFYPRLSRGAWVPAEARGRGIKGHGDLVRAAPMVLQEFPDAKFLLVGSGWGEKGEEYLQEVRELAAQTGLDSSVYFLGFREDANRILVDSDVAVQASLNENLGGTIESLLLARPTVATRVGGLVDTIKDGETGVLVNPSDPQDLARGIIDLLQNPEKSEEFGRAGRRFMLSRFTLQRTVSDLNSLYFRLMQHRREGRGAYNVLVSLGRLALSVPLFAYVGARLFFVDKYLFYQLLNKLPGRSRKKALKTPNSTSTFLESARD